MEVCCIEPLPGPARTWPRQLKDILSIAAEQHAESSVQRWDYVSISSPVHSKASQQRITTAPPPMAGTTSSPVQAPSHLRGHSSGPLKPPTCRRAHRGNEGVCTEYRACSQHHGVCSQGPRRSGATCATHASLSIFGHPTTSSSMSARCDIPARIFTGCHYQSNDT
jgi:hypothetical protein